MSGRFRALLLAVVCAVAIIVPSAWAGLTSSEAVDPTATSADAELAAQVRTIVEQRMVEEHLRAVIVRVTIDGEPIVTEAFGESLPGVPATTDMHFRNGAVAISYVATVLLQLVDEEQVSLDEKLSTWLPEVPHSDEVTLGQLAQMTSGYADYVQDQGFLDALIADPFRGWTPEELAAIGTSKPLFYVPGTNWDYAHTNYVLLGLALEEITGMPLDRLIQEKVLDPLGLENTRDPGTPAIQEPALHAYTAERRESLGIPAGTPFLEESTYWNPSWTLSRGAIQTTDITDMATTAEAIGSGELLTPESHALQVSTDLRGRTTAVAGCPTCFPQSEGYSYGMGVVTSGEWVLQNPMFAGYAGVAASLPEEEVAIAIALTYQEAAFDETGQVRNRADDMFRLIGAAVSPEHAPPMPRR